MRKLHSCTLAATAVVLECHKLPCRGLAAHSACPCRCVQAGGPLSDAKAHEPTTSILRESVEHKSDGPWAPSSSCSNTICALAMCGCARAPFCQTLVFGKRDHHTRLILKFCPNSTTQRVYGQCVCSLPALDQCERDSALTAHKSRRLACLCVVRVQHVGIVHLTLVHCALICPSCCLRLGLGCTQPAGTRTSTDRLVSTVKRAVKYCSQVALLPPLQPACTHGITGVS